MNTKDISFKSSLLNYISGRNDADAAIDKTYEKTLQDLLLRPFLAELDKVRLRRSQPPLANTSLAWPAQEIDKGQELSSLPFDIVAPHPDAALITGTPTPVRTSRGKVLDETL